MHLSAERELQVPPLSVPDLARLPDTDALTQYDAVALFVERAQAVKADFGVTSANAPAVAEICVRLDGLPLAIELAAARTKLLTPPALLSRLEQRFELLTGGPRDQPTRQQTLRATIDWSYDLLGREDQLLFAQLAVFAGGCTLDAAEAVCGGDGVLTGMATLIDNNLLRQDEQPDGEPRFAMLETVRVYALERLGESDIAEEVRDRHAAHFLAVAEEIVRLTEEESNIPWPRYERELDNFRAALDRMKSAESNEGAARLVCALAGVWTNTGHSVEGMQQLGWVMNLGGDVGPSLQARAKLGAASLAWRRGELDRARVLSTEALAVFRELDDQWHIGLALQMLAIVEELSGNPTDFDALSEAAERIFRELGREHAVFIVTFNRGISAIIGGDYARARSLLELCLTYSQRVGDDQQAGNALCDLGILALYEGRYEEALPLFTQSLESALRTGLRIIVAYTLRGLAAIFAARGEVLAAARMIGAAVTIEEVMGHTLEIYAAPVYTESAAPVLDRLSEPGIAAAYADGRAMSHLEAAAFALEAVAERAPL